MVGGGLELDTDSCFDLGGPLEDVHPQDCNPALGGLLKPLNYFQGGGLPGAVGAEDAKNFAASDDEGNPVNRGHRTESFDQALYLDRVLHDSIKHNTTNLWPPVRGGLCVSSVSP